MAEYEKNRSRYETDRTRKVSEVELDRSGTRFIPKPSYSPVSSQVTTSSRPAPQTQGSQVTPNQSTASSVLSPQAPTVIVNTEDTQGGGINIFKNVLYTTETGSNFLKVFDSNTDGTLRDILFVNSNTTQNLTFNLLLSRVDIKTITAKYPNQTIINSKDTVYLAANMLLAQAGTAPSNPKQLSLSEIVGTTQKIISGSKPFYLYIYKIADQGQLDVTVLK